MTRPGPLLRFAHLTQRFGDFTLFENLGFQADCGCFALRDEGGGGKTTLLGMLAARSMPTAAGFGSTGIRCRARRTPRKPRWPWCRSIA